MKEVFNQVVNGLNIQIQEITVNRVQNDNGGKAPWISDKNIKQKEHRVFVNNEYRISISWSSSKIGQKIALNQIKEYLNI